jgi:hypothetical protein
LHPESIAIGDLDQDGIPDLAVANSGDDTVSILAHRFHDGDDDGIPFALDTRPSFFSNDFTDVTLGGRTSGTIITRGDQILGFSDDPDAGVWVQADATGGTRPAQVTASCVDVVRVYPGGEAYLGCWNPFYIDVINGIFQVDFVVADEPATVTIDAGNYLTIDTSTSIATAPPNNEDTLVVLIGEGKVPVAPGQTVALDAPAPQIEILDTYVTRGGGGTRRHFWIGDRIYYNIDYEITGGNPDAKYDVIGSANSIYQYCSSKKARRARGVDNDIGQGVNTIRFRKRVPECVKPPDYVTARGEWPKVRLAIKLKTQDGTILLDRDRLRTRHSFAVHWD